MKIFGYITAVAALLSLAACNNNDLNSDAYNSDPHAVHIAATVGGLLNRSNPIGDANAFSNGDQIAVSTEGQGPVTYTYNNGDWTPESEKYLKWDKPSYTFTAYFPVGYTGKEKVLANQSSETEIAAMNYMKFEGEMKMQDKVTLTMQRQTARFIISGIDWGNQYMENNAPTHTVEEILINCVGTKSIKPFEQSGMYYVLLNPGDAVDETFITITLKSKKDEKTVTETVKGIPALAASTSYRCRLTIGKDKAELGEVTLKDWGTSETLWAGSATDGYVAYVAFGGKMTYDIHTPDGFLEVNKLMANGTQADVDNAVINLYTDVTLPTPAAGESNWTAIGIYEKNQDSPVKDWEIYSFNGNGHTIKGVVINNPDADYQGFLGRCSQVSNLTIEGLTVKGKEYVGGLTAYSSGGIIQNCTIKATENYPVLIEASSSKVGGLIGSCTNGTYSNCSVVCETGASFTIKGSGQVGGIIGTNTDGTISNCNVTNNGTKFEISGGDRGNRVGGIVGNNTGGPINDCNVTGVSIISGGNNIGGFVGNNSGNITGSNTVKNCSISGGYKTGTSITVGGTLGTPSVNITDGGGNHVTYTN